MSTAFFLQREPRRREDAPRPEKRDEPGAGVGRALVCAECLHAVTSTSARIRVSGGDSHTFANPHGFVFHVACYAVAPGCAAVTEASTDFSWFPGYAWQVAVCRGCGTHLGWLFRSADSHFHALIVDRLAETEGSSP